MHSQNAFDTSTYQICETLRDNNETPNFIMLEYNSTDYMAMADSVWKCNRILFGDTFGIICFCYALVYCSVKEVLQFLFSTRHEIGALVTKVFDITIGYML